MWTSVKYTETGLESRWEEKVEEVDFREDARTEEEEAEEYWNRFVTNKEREREKMGRRRNEEDRRRLLSRPFAFHG